jgi:pyrroloquinoline quinone biosynthesis protein D
MKTISLSSRPRRNERILQQEAAGTVVLLSLDEGQYYCLDEIGGRVWALCDGEHGVDKIAAALAEEYDAPPAIIQQDVLELLADLVKENLVESS